MKVSEHRRCRLYLATVGFDHPRLELRKLRIIQPERLVMTSRWHDDLGALRPVLERAFIVSDQDSSTRD